MLLKLKLENIKIVSEKRKNISFYCFCLIHEVRKKYVILTSNSFGAVLKVQQNGNLLEF